MRPRFTLAQTAALVCGFSFLFTTSAGSAGVHAHDKPVPILMYHVIGDAPAGVASPELFVRPNDFAAQMRWLAAHGFHAVTLQQVYEYWLGGTPLPREPIVLSFDDGYLGQHTHAMPILRKLNWSGVLNLKVDALKSRYTLPPWRVRQMLAAGWELDAHTITHPDLTRVDDAQLWREVHGSRVDLQRMFHVPVDFFCYPSGRYNAHVVAAVRRAGYLGATTTDYGLARPNDLYTLSRIRINGSDHLAGFAHKLQGLTR
jgi:peptidoglycan/xylan/chitin deacetylase (PgdA/CDA1 family)